MTTSTTFVFTPEEVESGCMSAGVSAELERHQSNANRGARSRTAEFSAKEILGKIRNETSGVYERTGGGVPNSYRQRAETTIVGVAWFTAPDGCLHVRVMANRVAAPKSSFGRKSPVVFVAADCCHPAACIYPVLYSTAPLKKNRKADPLAWELRNAIAADPLDATARAALCDHLQDRGADAAAELAALAVCRELTTSPVTV